MSVLVNAEYSPGSGPWWGIAPGVGTGEGASPLPAGGGTANPDTRWKAVSAIQCWLVSCQSFNVGYGRARACCHLQCRDLPSLFASSRLRVRGTREYQRLTRSREGREGA